MLFKANQSDAPATCERLFRYVSNISKRDDNSIVSQSDLAKATFFLGLRVAERWITTNDNSSSQINCAKKSRFYCMKFQSILAQKFMFINEKLFIEFLCAPFNFLARHRARFFGGNRVTNILLAMLFVQFICIIIWDNVWDVHGYSGRALKLEIALFNVLWWTQGPRVNFTILLQFWKMLNCTLNAIPIRNPKNIFANPPSAHPIPSRVQWLNFLNHLFEWSLRKPIQLSHSFLSFPKLFFRQHSMTVIHREG